MNASRRLFCPHMFNYNFQNFAAFFIALIRRHLLAHARLQVAALYARVPRIDTTDRSPSVVAARLPLVAIATRDKSIPDIP